MPPLLGEEQVGHAVAELDGLVTDAMDRTGVPGAAVAVVRPDRVLHLAGYGVREAVRPETVDADTVFQPASLSEPLASSVLAGVVGDGVVARDDPVIAYTSNRHADYEAAPNPAGVVQRKTGA